jgi:hypothetical protein
VPAVPAALEAAVLRALAKKPEERHPSMEAFVAALQAGMRAEDPRAASGPEAFAATMAEPTPRAATTAPAGRGGLPTPVALLAIGAVAAVAVAVALALTMTRAGAPGTASTATGVTATAVTSAAAPATAAATAAAATAATSETVAEPPGLRDALMKGGELPKDQIVATMKKHSSEIRECYEHEVRLKPYLAGRVVLSFAVTPTGAVGAVRVESSTLGDPVVEACMVDRLGRVLFPRPTGMVTITYPFDFDPSLAVPKKTAPPAATAATVPPLPRLTKAAVLAAITAAHDAFARCSTGVAATDRVTLSYRIDAAGAVVDARAIAPHARDATGACALRVLGEIRFPANDGTLPPQSSSIALR